jgi:hypothetical protein
VLEYWKQIGSVTAMARSIHLRCSLFDVGGSLFIGGRAFQGLEKARWNFPRLGKYFLNFSKAWRSSRLLFPIPGKTGAAHFQSLEIDFLQSAIGNLPSAIFGGIHHG